MITTKSLVVITEKSALINHVGVFIALVAKIIMIFAPLGSNLDSESKLGSEESQSGI